MKYILVVFSFWVTSELFIVFLPFETILLQNARSEGVVKIFVIVNINGESCRTFVI